MRKDKNLLHVSLLSLSSSWTPVRPQGLRKDSLLLKHLIHAFCHIAFYLSRHHRHDASLIPHADLICQIQRSFFFLFFFILRAFALLTAPRNYSKGSQSTRKEQMSSDQETAQSLLFFADWRRQRRNRRAR